jgi:hypothetical protein
MAFYPVAVLWGDGLEVAAHQIVKAWLKKLGILD